MRLTSDTPSCTIHMGLPLGSQILLLGVHQVQVGIISKQFIGEKKDGAIVRTISALDFPTQLVTVESNTTTSGTSTSTITSISSVLPISNMILTDEIRLYTGDKTNLSVPWFLCNGSAVSRNYLHELYRLTGINYESGDGAHAFNLPDFCGRVLVGIHELQENVAKINMLGSVDGEAMYQLTIDQSLPHEHSA
ncbi:unnamed protein product, partial [Rotaria sp. Silwood1]